jgi:hypothetical protein
MEQCPYAVTPRNEGFMKKFVVVGVTTMVVLAGICFGQYQVQTQVQTQVGPNYPPSPQPYSFRSAHSGDPFQFNWATGRWDYVPIADKSNNYAGSGYSGPYQFNWTTGQWNYTGTNPVPGSTPSSIIPPAPGAVPAVPVLPVVPPVQPSQPNNTPTPSATATQPTTAGGIQNPDDSVFWAMPTTRPQPEQSEGTATFTGQIVGMRAVMLLDDAHPHLLIRLRRDDGATGTVDVGEKLSMADFPPNQTITVHGHLGAIDGHAVFFAGEIDSGNRTIIVDRSGS